MHTTRRTVNESCDVSLPNREAPVYGSTRPAGTLLYMVSKLELLGAEEKAVVVGESVVSLRWLCRVNVKLKGVTGPLKGGRRGADVEGAIPLGPETDLWARCESALPVD